MLSPLLQVDPEVFEAITGEVRRQQTTLELIASENHVSLAVLEALGSVLTNKYAEGYPGARYYGGCEFVDRCERLAVERAKAIFGAEHANVQPHSGTQANMAVYAALLEPGDTILAMALDRGGHLSHGYKLNFSGRTYNSVFYGVSRETEQIDFDEVRSLALEHRPKLIISGASAYARSINFARFADIAREVGAFLMADIAHIAGLVAARLHPDPFTCCDVVTATTHKTMRGPRGGIIFSRQQHAQAIDRQVFPGMQGGPLMHVIAGKAIALKEAAAPGFRVYQEQILKNARALARGLENHGYRLVSGGTDNHMVLVDLTGSSLTGRRATDLLEGVGITVNKNLIPFDPCPPAEASGIRIGSPALTSRAMREPEMETVCELIHKTLSSPDDGAALESVRNRVRELCDAFPLYQRSYHM
ncbi:MAG: serine hydroxymethyltransferase [bacterium]